MSKYCMGCMEQLEDHINICPRCGYIEGTAAAQALHMQPGSILHDRYIVGASLGFGGFGVTYIAWDALLEQKVAIKEYLPSEFSTRMPGVTQITVYTGDKSKQFYDGLDRFVDEAKRLAKLQDVDGIVHIFDCFKENNTAYIVMEYLEGSTLAELLKKEKRYAPDEAISMLLPIIDSLAKVHEHGIIHRDIAPDNIFVTKEGTMKVIDFGAARYATTSHSRSLTVIIKPGYSPEEQYRSKSDQGSHTDVYALAATLYKMITGKTPPDALERRAFFENKKKDILKPLSVYCTSIDDNQENAILNAMNVRIEDRTPTMAKFKEELTSTVPVKRIVGKIRKIDLLRWPLWAKITMPIAACLILTFGVLFGTGVIKFESNLQNDVVIPDGMTRVPSVVNNTLESANTRLKEAVLLYMISGKEYSDDIPADYILTQDISAGSIVMQNSTLNIVISGGTQMISIPNVQNLNVDEATKQLEELGFIVKTNFKYDSVIAKDSVISQSLEADGETAVGTEIVLVVSSGIDPSTQVKEEKVTIPNFVGKSYQTALNEASKLGLTLSIEEKKYSSTYAKDVIISQNITAGSSGKTGDTIKLVVSLGKETIKIPDCQYKSETEAKTSLEKLGLKVSTTYQTSSSVSAGLVISQSPAANTELEPGDTVKLVVSKGSGTFAMPNVIGMSEANAKSTLTNSGLTVTVTYEYSNTIKSGNVINQSVSANTQISKGTSVVITVSSGVQTISVPNVVGQTEANAKNTLTNSGFDVLIVENYSDTIASGKVISQSPISGTSLANGSSVTITVSKGANIVESIGIKTLPTKTTYFVGETLNTSGLTLTAKYSDGTSKTISSGFTCSPTYFSSAGTKNVTVTYGNKSAEFTVTVKEVTLTSITIKTMPSKTTYFVGETLNTSGLTLSAQYSDGSTKTISSGFTCTPTSLTSAGTQTITVLYSNKSGKFNVFVQDAVAEDIVLSGVGSANDFQMSTNKIALIPDTISLSDDIDVTLSTNGMFLPPSEGNISAVVSYGANDYFNFAASVFPTSVSANDIKVTSSDVSIATAMVVSTSGNTAQLRIIGIAPGKAQITVSSKTLPSIEKSFAIHCYTNNSITWSISGDSGITIKTNNMYTMLGDKYGTNAEHKIVSWPTDRTSHAIITATIANGKYDTCDVRITKPEVTLTSISVRSLPTKTSYFVGDTLNTSGLTLTAVYSDGSTKTISSGFSCSPTSLTSVGTKSITVSYSGKTTSFNVSVENVEPTGINLYRDGTKLTFEVSGFVLPVSGSSQLSAEILPQNATNKTVTWFSSNPSVATVDSSGLVKAVSIGETTISVKTINGLTKSQKVSVRNFDFRLYISVDSVTDNFDGKTYSYNQIVSGEAVFHPGHNLTITYKLTLDALDYFGGGRVNEIDLSFDTSKMKFTSVSGNSCTASKNGSNIRITNYTDFSNYDNQEIVYATFLYSTSSADNELNISIDGQIISMYDSENNIRTSDGNNSNNSDGDSFNVKPYKSNSLVVGGYSMEIILVNREGNKVTLTTTSTHPDFDAKNVMWLIDSSSTYDCHATGDGYCTFSSSYGAILKATLWVSDSNGKPVALTATYEYVP